ncbi:MAG: anaerobic ribonucleoside-triphosphate reductase activating protein [Candidatus Bathyarchaeota archaeon]|nr:MAG: anaerobic ribonucleoside-triphosphate reductase activating protein [Candidatus Bathyarchaeota archaeon]
MRIRIGELVDISTVDWVGRPATMLFLGGCSFACPWCQNADLVPLNSGSLVRISDIEERISKNFGLIEGIGFSGGEPTLQEEALTEISSWAKNHGLSVLLNTNGSNPGVVQSLIDKDLIDEVSSDVKAPLLAYEYSKVIGRSLSFCAEVVLRITETLSICRERGIPVEIRTTIIPGLLDRADQIKAISRGKQYCERYILQQFFPNENIPDSNYRDLSPPDRVHLLSLAQVAVDEGIRNVFIRSSYQGLERVELK